MLVEANPEVYLPHLANTLSNLGGLLLKVYNLAPAKSYLEEALEIRRDLSKVKPEKYQPYVAMTLNNLGLLYRQNENYDKAKESYQEAIYICENLGKKFLPDVAFVLNNLGSIELLMNPRAGALTSLYWLVWVLILGRFFLQ